MKICKDFDFVVNYECILGVRKWNVSFENAPVAKLLQMLIRSDAF